MPTLRPTRKVRSLRLISFATLACAVLSLPVRAHAEVLWKGDFESGNLSQWSYVLNGTLNERNNIEIVNSPVVRGKNAARVTIHPDDLWSNGHNRVELKYDGKRTGENETTFFSWHFQLPADVQVRNDIAYWETQQTYSQSMALFVEPGASGTVLGLRVNYGQGEFWSTPISVGEWHHVAMEVFWSQDVELGHVSLWLDGEKVVDKSKGSTKPDGNDLFIQMGMHRNAAENYEEVIYLDEAVEATTLQEVLEPQDSKGDEEDDGGCAVTPGPANDARSLAALALGLALAIRRARRATAAKATDRQP